MRKKKSSALASSSSWKKTPDTDTYPNTYHCNQAETTDLRSWRNRGRVSITPGKKNVEIKCIKMLAVLLSLQRLFPICNICLFFFFFFCNN